MSAPRRRFVIEGTWSGYTSAQQRVVHRQVYPGNRKQLRAWAEKTYAIHYTDGTSLFIAVRDCEPRERVQEIKGYSSLIADCAHHGVTSVAALCDIEDRIKAEREARKQQEAP